MRLAVTAEDLRDPFGDADSDLKTALLGWLQDFWQEEEKGTVQRRRTGHKCRMFYLDEQLTWENPDTGWAEALPIPQGQLYWINNQFAPMVDNLVKEIIKSRSQFDFYSSQEDVDKTQVAKACTAIANHYQEKLLTPNFLENEVKASMFDAGAYRCLRWDENAGPLIDDTEDEEYDEEVFPAHTRCATCKAPVQSPGGQCQECGELDSFEDVPAETIKQTRPRVIGKKRSGDLVLESVPDAEMVTNSWATDLSWAVWLRRERRLDAAIARQMHPNAKIFGGMSTIDEAGTEIMLRQQRQEHLAHGRGNRDLHDWQQDQSPMLTERSVYYEEDWLAPVVYDHYRLSQDEILPDGTQLPDGKSLVELFPDGLKICRVSGEIVGLYNEDFHRHWLYVPYKSVPNRFYGKGVDGALPLQEWLNELVSIIMTWAMEASSPTRVVDGNVFPPGVSVGGIPSMIWRTENKPENVGLDSVYKVFPPGELGQGVYAMLDKIIQMMQSNMGAWSAFGSGVPDAAGNTATGMSLMQEAATNLMAATLRLRSNADKELMKLCLWHFRKNADIERAFSLGGPYSKEKVIKLSKANLDFDVDVSVKEGSYFPRQDFQRKADLVEYWTTFAQAGQAKMSVGEELTIDDRRILANRFNIPEAMNTASQAYDRAAEVFHALEEAAEAIDADGLPEQDQEIIMQQIMQTMAQNPTAMVADVAEQVIIRHLLDAVPLRVYADHHLDMAKAFRSLLNTDEGRDLSKTAEKAIEHRIGEHLALAQEIEPMFMGMPSPEQEQETAAKDAELQRGGKLLQQRGNKQGSQQLPTGRPALPTRPQPGR